MDIKYLCNLASYWLHAPWGWHESIETCSSVIICKIFVHLLVIVQNSKRCTVQVWKKHTNTLCKKIQFLTTLWELVRMLTTGFYVVRLATRRSDGSTTCLHVAQEGLRAGLVTEREKKFLPLPRIKLRFLARLCRLVLTIATAVSRISATLSKVGSVYGMRTWMWFNAIPRVLLHEKLHRVTSNVYIPLRYWCKVTGKKR